MQALCTTAMAAGLSLTFLAPPVSAQIDYRNLDDDRPAVTEDAYPVERYAFELLAPYRFEADAGGSRASHRRARGCVWAGPQRAGRAQAAVCRG